MAGVALGKIIGDGVHDPQGTADLLIDKLLSKDLLVTINKETRKTPNLELRT